MNSRQRDPMLTQRPLARSFLAVLLALVGAAWCLCGSPASAQEWPTRPVRIIVPSAAGGTGDIIARLVADHLAAAFKQPFVVENRVGAGGIIGIQAITSAAPDGYTFGITTVSTLALVPIINPKATYKPLSDFTHVAYLAGSPVVLSVAGSAGIKTLPEFIANARKSTKPMSFASSGVGSDGHLIGEAIGAITKIKVEHVPYRNTSQALLDVVGGHVSFSTFTLSSSSSYIREGTLAGIAVTATERLQDYANLPTFKESGYPELVSSTWYSLSGPTGVPPEIVERVNGEIKAAMAKPEIENKLRLGGLLARPMTAEQFTRFVEAESARWAPLIEATGLVGKGE
jgi:tripartite-type tricarboxylate transporter receptor subunit TctC